MLEWRTLFMEPAGEKEALIDEIVLLEAEIRALEDKRSQQRARGRKVSTFGSKAFLYAFFGRRLTRSLGDLIVSVSMKREPVFGPAMAKTLDAASLKLIGYKRWLVFFGALAALPGIISVVLLWQQNLAVAQETENTVADATNTERLRLLQMAYLTYDKSPYGQLTTPAHSAANRRRAVLNLIEKDAAELARTEDEDLFELNRMVDLSRAPLKGVDFSPLPGESQVFRDVGFVSSNFEDASFENCEFDHVWFSNAMLWRTNFRGSICRNVSFDETSIIGVDFRETTFIDCDFTGAVYDPSTQWPEDFDQRAAGALPYEEAQAQPQGN